MLKHVRIFDIKSFSSKGISQQFAQERLKADGPNSLKPIEGVPEWRKFLGKLLGGFHMLLWFGAILCLVAFFMEYSTSTEPGYDNVGYFR